MLNEVNPVRNPQMFIGKPKLYRASSQIPEISNGVNYKKIVKELENRERYGFLFGLERINRFLKKINHPEENLHIIHITGTNGKGSTAAFIAKILEFAGYQVGLYTSPHLIDIRERIQINGAPISKKDFVRLYSELSTINYRLAKELTYFEFLTALAFQYFFEKKVDFLVLEVGMGGRYDATNIIRKPLVSVITNIDYEHTEYLGKTLNKIAYEKAGIIKKNSLTITAIKQNNLISLLKRISAQRKNRIFSSGKDFRTSGYQMLDTRYQIFDYRGLVSNYRSLRIKLLGRHQIENGGLALATIEVLRLRNIFISERAIREGLENTFWPGRLEVLKLITHNSSLITVLLDGAHNPAGMKVLKLTLSKLKRKKMIVILGILADKDIAQMVKEICPLSEELVITKADYYRAVAPEIIYLEARKYLNPENIFLQPIV